MKRFSDNKYFIPKRYDFGTPQRDITDALETPRPLAKGYDGLPSFNELQEAQKRNIPKAMRSQVAFQQKKLQWSNYQIINFEITPTASASSATAFAADYNQATAVGTALTDGVIFGTTLKGTEDVNNAKYYNIVYANVRLGVNAGSTPALSNPCYVEFYPMQKLTSGDMGGKIPRQIEAVSDITDVESIVTTGAEFGVQSFGVDVFNENAYYTQTPDLKGIRCCGIALKKINLKFAASIDLANITLDVEIGYDLKTEGNNY